jgi:hypothetical protein
MDKKKWNLLIFMISVTALIANSSAFTQNTIKGTVFEDSNRNLKFNPGEKGVEGILVSNQIEVVTTDADGKYTLPISEKMIIFITKPAGYELPLNEVYLPQFYYIHDQKGSPAMQYPGISTTGPLPVEINFPIFQVQKSDTFTAVIFSDPQPRSDQELSYIRDDVISELIGTGAKFGITLGDILYDDLSLFERYNKIVAQIGIPFFNVPGNHDMNYDAVDDVHSLETFKKNFGPPYYAFQYGKVHFIVLDNVEYQGENKKGNYIGRIGAKQLQWLANQLQYIPEDHLIVLNMHIPFHTFIGSHPTVRVANREKIFSLIQNRKHLLALAGHMHMIEHQYLGKENDWNSTKPLHQIICGAVSGSWWSGPPDVRGIPIADQRDGVPNGYHVIRFEGNSFRERYKAAQYDQSYQLRISQPSDMVNKDSLNTMRIVVNVFNGSEKTRVTCTIDDTSPIKMNQETMIDPYIESIHTNYPEYYLDWIKPRLSNHIWTMSLPSDLNFGIHKITVQAINQYGNYYQTTSIFEIE